MSALDNTVTPQGPATPKGPVGGGTGSGAGGMLQFFTSRLREIGIFIALIVIVLLFQALTGGRLLTAGNVSNIIVQNSYILILAIGMVMIIIAGHIDLSAGSVVAVTGAISAVLMVNWQLPWPLALLITIIAGALIGAFQGYWVAYFGIPAFIVTLAGMLAFRGAAQIALQNQQISPFPQGFRDIGSGFLPTFGSTGYEPLTLVLGAIAAEARWLAERDDVRFMNEVALRLQG